MFEKYKESQKEFYDAIISSVVNNKKISHAYFIETNGFKEAEQLVISFAKLLLCTSHFVENSNCKDCNLCDLIDHNNCLDLKIISPDGNWIKKEQLLQLQTDYKTKALTNNYRIYIINEADKLNNSAANSILKFLEEPEDNIIAILLANNRYKVLDTIVSRCQIYKLINNEALLFYKNNVYIQITYNFLKNVELYGTQTIAHINDLFSNTIKSKENLLEIIPYMEQFYKMLLDCFLNRSSTCSCFNEYQNDMIELLKKNDLASLVRKINIIYSLEEKIQFNSNQNLLIDKLIIDLSGGTQ